MMDLNTGKLLLIDKSYEQSISLILLTPKGEKVLNRNFGSSVIKFLGQPINNVAIEISAEVIASLQENDKRILVDNVSVKNNNNIGLTVEINYNGSENTNVNIT